MSPTEMIYFYEPTFLLGLTNYFMLLAAFSRSWVFSIWSHYLTVDWWYCWFFVVPTENFTRSAVFLAVLSKKVCAAQRFSNVLERSQLILNVHDCYWLFLIILERSWFLLSVFEQNTVGILAPMRNVKHSDPWIANWVCSRSVVICRWLTILTQRKARLRSTTYEHYKPFHCTCARNKPIDVFALLVGIRTLDKNQHYLKFFEYFSNCCSKPSRMIL